jgi:hypothetical protein
MASRVEFAVSATPIVSQDAAGETPAFEGLAADVARSLGASGSALVTWGTTGGYAAGAPVYASSGVAGAVAQVSRITPGGSWNTTHSSVWGVTINGITITTGTVADSKTLDEICAAIRTAINGSTAITDVITVTNDNTYVTLTAKVRGTAFTVTDPTVATAGTYTLSVTTPTSNDATNAYIVGKTATALATATTPRFVYIRHTGCLFATTAALGAVTTAKLKICMAATIAAATTIAVLNPGEAIVLPFNDTVTSPTFYVAPETAPAIAVEVMATP